jgi:1-acyl-sn-glycerol-3-phosphate acyltransferase
MRDLPRRLRRRGAQASLPRHPRHGALDPAPHDADEGRTLTRRARVVRRLLTVVAWTLPAMPVQAVCLLLPGRPKVVFARWYWAVLSRLLGLRVRVIGERAGGSRPVVFVSNHSSWVDVPVLGGVLDGCFVAKGEVAGWPLISTIAKLGRTVFVTRQRGTTLQERDEMRRRLVTGDNLILFPEGTSSDGSRVLPFRTSFFAVTAAGEDVAPLIQPVSVVYDRLGGLPIGRAGRPVFAWYGDMDIASHFWRLGQHKGLRVTVVLHAALDPARYPDRKVLSQAVWRTVAEGAATLRQNRPARPLGVEEAMPSGGGTEPAFA